MAPLFGDLAAAYPARAAGEAPAWPPLAVQYADYALWQRELLGDRPTRKPARPAARLLGRGVGRGPAGARPAGRPAAPGGGHRAARLPFGLDARGPRRGSPRWPGSGCDALHGAAGGAGGAAHPAGRRAPTCRSARRSPGATDEALDDLVGFFVNTLVLRTDTSGNPTFGDWSAGSRHRPRRLRPPGPALRAAGGGAQPGPLHRPPPARPGHADAAARRRAAAGRRAAGAASPRPRTR